LNFGYRDPKRTFGHSKANRDQTIKIEQMPKGNGRAVAGATR